jgi:PAS domain S-box-containing protein
MQEVEDEAGVSTRSPELSVPDVLAQQAAIAEIGQHALQNATLDELLDEACERVRDVLGASIVSITELDREKQSLRVVAGVGYRAGVVGSFVIGVGDESQAGYTLARGEPVIVDDLATESRFNVPQLLFEHGAMSGISVRIGGADDPFGTLAVFGTRHGQFAPPDANFLYAVANILGAAVKRFEIETELRESRDQLATIVNTIDEGITVQSRGGLVFANDEAARIAGFETGEEMVAGRDVVERFEAFDESEQPMRISDLPSRRAMAQGHRTEAVLGFRRSAADEIRWALVRGAPVNNEKGNISYVVTTFRDVTEERWQGIARSYMAEAVGVLSSTLDADDAAQRLADLSVPLLADYCTVSLLQPDGSIRLVALAHVNPERVELVRRLQRSLPPPDPNGATGSARVIRESVVDSGEVTPEMIDVLPLDDEQRATLRELELRSYVTVPVRGRSKPIGALTLAMAESGRRLGDREIELAKELGARAGVALENARLYQTADTRREELDAVLAALAEAVLVFDRKGKLRMGNQAANATFSGALPQTVAELWARTGHDAAEMSLATALPSEPIEADVDGRGRFHELRFYQGQTTGADGDAPTVVVLRDVTENRAARAARDAFMGVLSHELRTPITTIYGGSELLARDLDEERRAEVLADIRAESERLARLVEDLLVMTRVERGIVEIADEPILLQHLLASVILSSTARWPGARVTLHAADRLPAVRGDATYIEQVVRNLLTNAVRYGEGLNSGIDVYAETASPEEVVVRVQDNGSGFGGEEPDRLFELFYRTSSARSVPGGAGIGLFVCRNLIEKMGGRIWALERAEGGAEFGFSLPVVESDAAL